jgi:hypothetical protein
LAYFPPFPLTFPPLSSYPILPLFFLFISECSFVLFPLSLSLSLSIYIYIYICLSVSLY